MARKRSPGIALSSLTEALQTMPVRDAIGRADRRSIERARGLVRDLEADHRPKEIARALGISTQKYVWTRRYIERGQAANPVLNDLLAAAREQIKLDEDRPTDRREDYQYRNKRGKISKKKLDFVEVGEDYIKKKLRWARDVKPGGFASKQSAKNWMAGVTGGKEYFWLVRKKNGRWHIYDNRTAAERNNRGKVGKKSRAQKLKEKDSPEFTRKKTRGKKTTRGQARKTTRTDTRHGKAKTSKPRSGSRAKTGRGGRAKKGR